VIGAVAGIGDAWRRATRRMRRRRHFVVHHGVDEETLLGIGGGAQIVVFGGEFGEIVGFCVEIDLVNGIDSVLEGVESGHGWLLDLRLAGDFGAGGWSGRLSALKWPQKGLKIKVEVL
jgi:hypothetical protein